MIERWIMDSGYRRPDPKGMWVRYTDHVDAIKRLQAEVERLQGICRGNAIRELELGEEIERLNDKLADAWRNEVQPRETDA